MMTLVAAIRHRTSREAISLLVLFLSWPVCLVHRFWNNAKVHRAHWFVMDVHNDNGLLFTQDIQWYIFDTGNMLSTTFIILSLIIIRTKTTSYRWALSAVLTVSIVDIIHYWLCYKQSEYMVMVEGLIMLLAASLIACRKWKII